jgi:hypothetical protein
MDQHTSVILLGLLLLLLQILVQQSNITERTPRELREGGSQSVSLAVVMSDFASWIPLWRFVQFRASLYVMYHQRRTLVGDGLHSKSK